MASSEAHCFSSLHSEGVRDDRIRDLKESRHASRD